jgi:luciferase family oxidoreductase group 1
VIPTLSVLDLAPVPANVDAGEALRRTIDLARHAERLGFRRYWLAEHHNMPGIASAATSVVIGAVAGATSTIRVGAGGIMLPNHAPLVIAEQFGTLEALYPGRIDLGLGRAPGTDGQTAAALRRNLLSSDTFPHDVIELATYFREPQAVNAFPGLGARVPIWLLGSSLYSAGLAAHLGLPFAFASHFAPAFLDEALALYRENFRPSDALAEPYAIAALSVVAADSEREARTLFSSQQQAFLNLRRGRPGKLPAPIEDYEATLLPMEREGLATVLSCAVIGTRDAVADGLARFAARTGADELIVTANIYDYAARVRSFEILADAAHVLTAA